MDWSQQIEYGDLLSLLVDEEYEKCLKKSLKYTEKDATKKHPLPYLYASMAYFEMSRDHQYSSTFPKAYRKSLSYAVKYRKKDKLGAYKNDGLEHIERLKIRLAEEIENYKLDGSEKANRKIVSTLKKVTKMDPDDYGAQAMLGLFEIKNKNRSEGREILKMGLDSIYSQYTNGIEELTESQQLYFKESLLEVAGYYRSKDVVKARKVLKVGKDYFYEQNEDCVITELDDYRAVYEDLFG